MRLKQLKPSSQASDIVLKRRRSTNFGYAPPRVTSVGRLEGTKQWTRIMRPRRRRQGRDLPSTRRSIRGCGCASRRCVARTARLAGAPRFAMLYAHSRARGRIPRRWRSSSAGCARCSIGSALGSGNASPMARRRVRSRRPQARLLDDTVIGLCDLGHLPDQGSAAMAAARRDRARRLRPAEAGARGERRSAVPGGSRPGPPRAGARASRSSWRASLPFSAGRCPAPSARCAVVSPRRFWTRRSPWISRRRGWSGAVAACSPSCAPGWRDARRPAPAIRIPCGVSSRAHE